SLGIIVGERIPYEASPASIPQRQVAGERPDNSLGKGAIVVVVNVCALADPSIWFSSDFVVKC
ncbi:hypothetical protein Tco_0284527, partial [Tanacetum coccineum]